MGWVGYKEAVVALRSKMSALKRVILRGRLRSKNNIKTYEAAFDGGGVMPQYTRRP